MPTQIIFKNPPLRYQGKMAYLSARPTWKGRRPCPSCPVLSCPVLSFPVLSCVLGSRTASYFWRTRPTPLCSSCPGLFTFCPGLFTFCPGFLTFCFGFFTFCPCSFTFCLGFFTFWLAFLTFCLGLFTFCLGFLTFCPGFFTFLPVPILVVLAVVVLVMNLIVFLVLFCTLSAKERRDLSWDVYYSEFWKRKLQNRKTKSEGPHWKSPLHFLR